MANLFGIAAESIGDNASMESIENWDSLQHVTLVMALEQEFGVQLDVEDAFAMTDFRKICQSLERAAKGGQRRMGA